MSKPLAAQATPCTAAFEMIRASHVIGLILDFHERCDPAKELRVLEYDSAYPPVTYLYGGVTLHEAVARCMRRMFMRKHLSMQTCVISAHQIPRSGPIDANVAPRRALLEAMLHVRSEADLSLLTNALRALRRFESNELLIYREMLLNQMERSLIMKVHREPGAADKDVQWDSYMAGLLEGRALAVLDLLRIRGIEIDPASEEKVLTCRDRDQLIVWIARAMTLVRVEELFEPCWRSGRGLSAADT